MAISRITSQDASGTGANQASATYGATPTKGNLLIAIESDNDGGNFLTNTGWTTAVTAGSSSGLLMFWKIAGASEPTVVTTMNDSSASHVELSIYEYQGFIGQPILDLSSTTGTTSNSGLVATTPTTATTNVANELLFAAVNWGSGQTISSWSNSFTTLTSVGGAQFTAQRIVSATGTYSTAATVTGSSSGWNALLATFRGSSSITF